MAEGEGWPKEREVWEIEKEAGAKDKEMEKAESESWEEKRAKRPGRGRTTAHKSASLRWRKKTRFWRTRCWRRKTCCKNK